MNTLLLILALLAVKHFFFDFVFQYNYMLSEKGIYGARGGFDHSFCHALGTWLVLTPFVGTFAAIVALADGLIHYHIDWAKVQLSKGLSSADRAFWVWFGVDQLLHYLTYLTIAYYITQTVL